MLDYNYVHSSTTHDPLEIGDSCGSLTRLEPVSCMIRDSQFTNGEKKRQKMIGLVWLKKVNFLRRKLGLI